MLVKGLGGALRAALAMAVALSVAAPAALAEPAEGTASENARSLAEVLEKVGGTTPGPAADGVLLAAQAEQGTRERFVEVVLAQPTKSHSGIERWGENNNRYTRWYGLNDAWCGMFVDWCAREAGVPTDVIPHGIAYMPTLKNHYLGGPNWHDWTYRPQAGDLVMYSDTGADDDAGHVGVVTGADGSRFYTREGNRGDDWVVDDSWAYGTRWTGYGGSMSYIDGFISPSFPAALSADGFDFGPNVALPAGDGTYTICSTLDKSLYLDGGGGSTDDGANVTLSPGDGDEPQRRWDFRGNDDGTYTIFRHGTNKVLDVSGISLDDGTNVQIWESGGSDNQRWYVQDCGNGTYALKAKHSGKFLDATDAAPHAGTNVQQWHGWANDAVSHQKFIISLSFGPRASLPAGDGTYTICSTLDKSLYLDGGGGSTDDGANVTLWPGDGDEPQRRWDFRRNDDGTYTIARHGTNEVLDVSGISSDNGANVHIWRGDGGECQRWWLEDCGNGVYALKAKHSGKFLDATDAAPHAGTNVQQWHGWANGTESHQKFIISPSYGPSVKLPSGSGADGVTYTISTSIDPSTFVGAAGDGATNGDNGELFIGADKPQCRWDIKRNDDGTYTIWRSGTSKVLGVSGITMADGANVHLWEIVGGNNQRWWVEDCGNGCYALKSKHSGKFLDLSGGVTDPGTNVHQWRGNFGKAQQFLIAPALDLSRDGWATYGGAKYYVRGGALVTGWMDLGGSKYYFQPDGAMSTGWTDVDVNGKAMRYYFNPSSGNLARGTWMTIGGHKYYFRPSGNLATGWATISDNGVDKKYYLDADGQLLTGWQDIEVNGKPMRYYFRPSGAMATGWATIDGEKYWFRPSGNMATGWADVDDAYKRYFDGSGHMLVGWQTIGGRTYYFRASGAMQTGKATIDGASYEFSASGTLKSGNPPKLTAQDDGTVVLGSKGGATEALPDVVMADEINLG